jgi:phosphopentomutase
LSHLRAGDLICLTADHGNDPTWTGTDHTREQVPVLFHGQNLAAAQNLGIRPTFADIGQTLASYLAVPAVGDGTAMF